jgi:uncharacterized repeat protein (TIGR03803 family)
MSTSQYARVTFAAIVCAVLVASAMLTTPAQAQTFSVVGIIPSSLNDGTSPNSAQITQGRNGDVYTVTGHFAILSATTSGTFAEVAQVGGPNGVTLGADGDLYTNFYFDRVGCGEVIKTTPSGTSGQIASICGTYGNGPYSAPIQALNGGFYGTSTEIPSGGNGTIYSMTSSGTLGLLHTFTGTDGKTPYAPLVVGSDGALYGGTANGGTNGDGVLFKITTGGTYTVLHNLTGTDGRGVGSGLFLGRDGNLYGVTQSGGTDNIGVAFKLTTGGVYSVIYNFLIPYTGPNSSLVQATDGKLYGLLGQGNASQPGWIYSLTTAGAFTLVHEFCQATNCTDGAAPSTPLIQHSDGKLYGFTVHGGDTSVCSGVGCGVFYSFDVGLKPFVTLVTISGKVGSKIGILGQGFSAASVVKFNGVTATTVTRTGTTFLMATVPAGATDGYVTVTTGTTTLTSSNKFTVHDSWSTGTAMPTARFGAFAGAIGSNIYVIGGATNSGYQATNVNEIYNTQTNKWTTGAPDPTSRELGASAMVNGILYVIGGSTSGSNPLALVEAYNPVTNTWTTKSPMPTARNSMPAVVDKNIIYVIGGYDPNTGVFYDNVESYNPATDTWTARAPLPVATAWESVGLLGTTIVAVDGQTGPSGTIVGSNEGYNVTTNTWSTLAADATPRLQSCFAAINGELYVAGGADKTGVLSINEGYNSTTKAWKTLAPMPNARATPSSATVGGRLYCFGGASSGLTSVYSNVQIYQP